MKRKLLATIPLLIATAAGAQSPTIEQLQSTVDNMQKTIQDLQQQIIELKKQQQMAPPPAAAAPPTMVTNKSMTLTPETVTFSQNVTQVTGRPSEVTWRNTLNDQQEGAPRANDLTLDPQYRGFIPIPNTPAIIKFNAKPRVDFTSDNRNSGNPDRFVTAQIPVDGDPNRNGGNHFNVNARGSSLRLDVRAPDFPGAPRFYYENDFFGSGSGMPYRVKQLYGEYYNITAGWTFSIFEDPDVWPDTVDFEGPNSMIFARQPTLRYLLKLDDHWQMNFGIQQPSSDIDNSGLSDVNSVNHAPDGGMNVRWEDKKIGHVQLAAILRDVGANSPTFRNQDTFGWGLMAATSLNVLEKDSVQLQATYGEGYFHFANDNFSYTGFSGGDAAYDKAGNLKALPFFSAMAGYTHHWCDAFRSTATFGFNDLDNAFSQDPHAYHRTYYASGNIVYQIRKRLSVGLEALYGRKEVKNGDDGDVFRVQLGIAWALFD
jgi:hypothetical protein